LYVDSNIFIFAATNKGKLGKNCREIIKLINEQKITCAASFLVIDEVIWVLKKNVGKDSAIKITKAMLSMPIKWIEVDKSVIIKTIDIFEKTKLKPRDAMHIASMKDLGLSLIISEDKDFDKVNEIKRVNTTECMEKYT
jgi:predicted nucleic acid-binding protein